MAGRGRREVYIEGAVDAPHGQPVDAVVFIDVLLSTTTIVTAVGQGRRTMLAATVDEGRLRARGLLNPILTSEPGLSGAQEFSSHAGPAALQGLADTERPVVLFAPSLLPFSAIEQGPATYFACLRNISATVEVLTQGHERVKVVGAGHGGEARCEDQLVAGWIAGRLAKAGFAPGSLHTAREIERWAQADVSVIGLGRGAEHLKRMGRGHDLDFVLSRVDDLDVVCRRQGHEVQAAWAEPVPSAATGS